MGRLARFNVIRFSLMPLDMLVEDLIELQVLSKSSRVSGYLRKLQVCLEVSDCPRAMRKVLRTTYADWVKCERPLC